MNSIKKIKNKKNLKRGISLIVLVIAIIVIVILAVAVILSIANNNPIENAKEATKKNDDQVRWEEAQLYFNEWYTANQLSQKLIDPETGNEVDATDIDADDYVIGKLRANGCAEEFIASISVTENGVVKVEGITAANITADDYGKYANYTTPCEIESDTTNGIGGWQIFYSDKTNIYLIADNYIYKTYAPHKTEANKIYENSDYKLSMDNVINDYNGTSNITDINIKNLNKMYFDKNYTSTSENMKAVAYMLDTSIWNNKFRNETYADYAIGGPSLEMFVNSYNESFKDTKIEIEATNATGYKIKWSSDASYNWDISGLQTNNMYVITDESKAYAMWLCSPSAFRENSLFHVNCVGGLGGDTYSDGYPGFRPVVCLKSDILLQRTEDGFEIKE